MATRLVLPGALTGLVLGILAADAEAGSAALLAAAVFGAVAAILLLRWPAGGVACAALIAGLLLGAWRGTAVALPSGPGSVIGLIGRGEADIVGTVADDPRPRGSTQQVVVEDVIARLDGHVRALRGRLLVTLPRAVPVAVGRRILLTAEVEAPAAFDGFDYPAYLARQGIGALVRARDARIVDGETSVGPAGVSAAARSWLLAGLNEMVPEPEAALGAGILLGVRSSIAPEVADAFAVAGLTHVVAISGWNIAIVAAIVGAMLRPLEERRGGRWVAPSAAAATIAGYVVLTGASPSVVRAALMAGAMMVARFGGSRAHASSALGLAAAVMLAAAPSVLWDVGFQLSALATAGLILFGATIEGRLAGWPAWLREPVALTIAAQLVTLPIVVASFGRLSLVAPLANVVVVPLVPLVMLLCAIAAPLGGDRHEPPVRPAHRTAAMGRGREYLAAPARHDRRRADGRIDPLRVRVGCRAGLAGAGLVPDARARLEAIGETSCTKAGRRGRATTPPAVSPTIAARSPGDCSGANLPSCRRTPTGRARGRRHAPRRPDADQPSGRPPPPRDAGHRTGRRHPGHRPIGCHDAH